MVMVSRDCSRWIRRGRISAGKPRLLARLVVEIERSFLDNIDLRSLF